MSCFSQIKITPGAAQLELYLKILDKDNIAVVAHQASLVNSKTHLVDTLLSLGVNIKKFSLQSMVLGEMLMQESVLQIKRP